METPWLICLPPAGAGPSLFRPWRQSDPRILAPTLPGREARFGEAAAASLPDLAEQLAREIASTLPAHHVLFGYSMGGTLALLLADRLRAMNLPGPRALYVLGAPAPHKLHEGVGGLAGLPGDAFWTEIARIGGTPSEILADPEMRALLEPTIRNDFALCAEYRPQEAVAPLSCPIHAFVAEDDHLVAPDSVREWASHTTGPTQLHPIPGGHMLGMEAFARLRGHLRGLPPVAPLR